MACEHSTDIGLEQIVANAHDGVFVMDRERRFVLFNKACERLTGYRADEVLGAGPV